MPHKVRVTFDDEAWETMTENAPATLNDPETVRFWAGLGLLFVQSRTSGLYDAGFALEPQAGVDQELDDTDRDGEE